VFLGGSDRRVIQWEYEAGTTQIVGAHLGPVHSLVVIPQSGLVASSSKDGTARIWHTGSSRRVASFSHNSAIRSLDFTPDSKFVVVGADQKTVVIDSTSGEASTTLPVTGVMGASADANLLVANEKEGKRIVWDVAATQVRAHLPVGPKFAGAAFSRDGNTLATWSRETSEKGSVWLWDLTASRMRLRLQHGSYGSVPPDIHSAAFSSDGRTLALATQFGALTLWDTESGRQRLTLQPFIEPTHGEGTVEFSNDGKMLAAGDSDGTLRLWNVESGALQVSFKGHASRIQSVAFSPDDKRLLSGGADKTVRLWDVVTGQELYTFGGHDSPVHLVVFAPDGKRVATASQRVVKLWLAGTEPEATAFRVELDPDDPQSPRAINLRGDRLFDSDQLDEAESAYRTAQTRLVTLLAADHRNLPEYRQELAYSLLGSALLQLRTNRGQMDEQVRHRLKDIYRTLDPDLTRILGSSFQRRAVAQMRLGRWTEAVALMDESIELTTDNWIWYADRAGSHVELGNWHQAAQDLATCLELPGASGTASYFHALLCLQLGQKANYQRACTDMLNRFKQLPGTRSATMTIWVSVLGPDAVADWTSLLRLAEETRAEDETTNINYLGAVLYRAGRFEEAAQRLAEAEALAQQKTSTSRLRVCNWLFQAMTQHQLGHAAEAKGWFEKAVRAIDGSTTGTDSLGPRRWEREQTFTLLRREAAELLKK
jgi:WD40 repeat protein/tetratricopeptide (TPR) repeat protein